MRKLDKMGKSLKANTILNAFRLTLMMLTPLITFPYISRIFLTEGSGKINFVTSVVSVFTLFASLGIYGYGIREGAKVRENKELFSKLAIELFIINLVATIITYIVFFLSVEFYAGFAEYRELLIIYGVTIGFSALGLDWVYGAYEEYAYITLRQIAVQIFTIISMFIFVHNESDIYKWIVLLAISTVGCNLFNFIHARKYVCKVSNIKLEIGKHIKPILIMFSTTLAAKVYSNIDVLLLGIMATDHNVGLYSAAVKVNTMLITFFSAMTPVFMPRIIEYKRNGDNEGYYLLLRKIYGLILMMGIPAVIGLEMVSEDVILILGGSAFAEAAITMRYLAPIILITSCSNILYYDILVPDNNEVCVSICTIVGAVINLILTWLFIPAMMQDGAALGSLISELVAFFLAVFYCLKQDKKLTKIIPSIKNYLIGGVLIAIICHVCGLFIDSVVIRLFASIIISGCVYAITLVVAKDSIAYEAINMLKRLIKNVDKGHEK